MNVLESVWPWIVDHALATIGLVVALAVVLALILRPRSRPSAPASTATPARKPGRLNERLEEVEREILGEVPAPSPEPPPAPAPAPAQADRARSSAPAAAGPAGSVLAEPESEAAPGGGYQPAVTGHARSLEIEAGRLAYQIPRRMWLGARETVEVRLGTLDAQGIMDGFTGSSDVRTEDAPIVETMSVTLVCEPGTFEIEARSDKDQLVKPDLVKGTPFHKHDFAKWTWLVTPLARGDQTLFVKVSAAIRDSRGLPVTSSLPDKVFPVTVRVHLVGATFGAIRRFAPGIVWAVVTTLVGIFTRDYWWPALKQWLGLG